jgi:hypothetical protein
MYGFLKLKFHLFIIIFFFVFVCVSGVQVLSMSRLGGAAAVAPLVADMSSEVLKANYHNVMSNYVSIM